MRIVFITTGDIKDIATSKRALGMANPLSELGWKVHVIMEDTLENKSRVALECDSNIILHYFPKSNSLTEILIKSRIVKELNPDFIYLCAFVFRNLAFVGNIAKLVEHSELPSGMLANKRLKLLKTLILEYYSIIYADGLLSASRYLETVFTKRQKRIFKQKQPHLYFPYAFQPEIYKPLHNSINESKKRYEGKFIIVYLGSMAENYGLFTMLEAMVFLKSEKKNVLLLLVGKGSHYEAGKKYIKDNNLDDVVEMPGYVDEEIVPEYFEYADAFISPLNDTVQDWARCPSKLYMYLPYKKPIITCKIGEPYEVLGDGGFYYLSGDSKNLAKTCIETMDNDKTATAVDPELHTWKTRSIEFDKWIFDKFIFKKNG